MDLIFEIKNDRRTIWNFKNYFLSDFEGGDEMVNFHGGQLAPKFDLPQMYIQGCTSCLTG